MIYFISNLKELVAISTEGDLPYVPADIDACIDYCKNKKALGFDTETTGLNVLGDKVIMLQIGDKDNQFVIDARNVNILGLKPILESEEILKIGHNLKFDRNILLNSTGIRLFNVFDTMLAEAALYCGHEGVGYGLDKLTKRYLNIEMDKGERKGFINHGSLPFSVGQIIYGGGDVKHLPDIYNLQLAKLKKYGLTSVAELDTRSMYAFAEIENNGILLDAEKWKELDKETKKRLYASEQALEEHICNTPGFEKFVLPGIQKTLFGLDEKKTTMKWSSSTQVTEVLKVLEPSVTSSGKEVLYKYKNKHKLFEKIINYRELGKKVSTYGDNFLEYIRSETGRVHTSFWLSLATGRVSSGQKKRDGSAYDMPNLQNIPKSKDYRHCFVAPKGKRLVISDYSTQELRLVAEYSGDPVWISAFKEGKDLHAEVAKIIFSIEDHQVKEEPDFLRGKAYRDVAKTINYMLVFGGGEHKLANSLNIKLEKAKEFIDKYFAQLPKVKAYLDGCGNFGIEKGYIRTAAPISRIRWFPEWRSAIENRYSVDRETASLAFKQLGNIDRRSRNTPIQGGAAHIVKLAMWYIYKHIQKNDLWDKVKIILQVHDEIICEVNEDYAQEWAEIQENLMIEAGKVFVKNVEMLVDTTVSNKWEK